jgi:MFS transporter, DHA1 family, multidrug resistance protein
MAASLQGFVSGMVNTLDAGIISPALSPSVRGLAIGMVAMMLAGLASWLGYRKISSLKPTP